MGAAPLRRYARPVAAPRGYPGRQFPYLLYWVVGALDGGVGLASFEEHLDQFPPEGPDEEMHYETAEAFLAGRAARTGESGRA